MVLFYRLSGSLATMSFFGAMVVLLSYLSMPVLRKHPTNMVFFLSVCDLLFSLKFIITAVIPDSEQLEDKGTVSCILQAGWAQFLGLASISWNGMISLNLIINLHTQGFARTSNFGKWYHLFVWSLSILTTSLMFISHDRIGPSGDGTCWIETNTDPLRLLFFVPLLIYFSISLAAVILAFVRTSNGVMSDASRRGLMLRMTSYVLVFLLCWSGPVIHRINLLARPPQKPENPGDPSPLQLWDAVGVSIQGFANAMVWLTNPSFFTSFKSHLLERYCGCLLPDEERHPILSGIQETLTDSRHDINRIGQILRRNIITCILLGVKQSLGRAAKTTFTQKCYADVQYYNYDDLYAGEDSADGQAQRFQFIDYAPLVFANIRDLSNISTESYGASMNPKSVLGKLNDQLAKFSDGRSNSFFIFTPDKRFIIKTITSDESKLLRDILPRLHEYFEVNRHSLITRFYGCHAVRVSHGELVHVVVMGNVFSTSVPMHECYDLKGSWVNRSSARRRETTTLGMDLDLNRKLKLAPMYKELFLRQVQNDALLLCSLGIMDYSLLLGFHFTERVNGSSSTHSPSIEVELTQIVDVAAETYTLDTLPGSHGLMQLTSIDKKEVYCIGIIDVLQLYTTNKKLERFAKVYLLHKDGAGLSSIPPRSYADRFAEHMKKIVI